jgi:hypothetical protein
MGKELKTVADATKMLAKQGVAIEDSAVSEYIKQQASWLIQIGENLADYYLIRESGTFTLDDSKTIKQSVYYGLKHKDSIKKVEFQDE